MESREELNYRPRIADQVLARLLKQAGAVQIKGPRWCGKTATAQQAASSSIYLQDPDQAQNYLQLASTKPSLLLDGEKPRLVDEWQMAPQLWDAVRFKIDREKGRGKFILTGSATPRKGSQPAHSGIGRIVPMKMRTMSLYESGESSADVSLSALFEGNCDIGAVVNYDIEDIAFAICRGGWPEAVTEPNRDIALSMSRNYIHQLLESDIEEMDGIVRNKTWMRLLLRSYARNISSSASLSTIASDMQANPPSRGTVSDYVEALSRAYVIEDLEAWLPTMRSKTALRTNPTRHFCDPSLAASVLGATPETLLQDFETFGLFFESMCVRDLRVYSDALGGSLFHYRDKTDLEADAVIVLDDGRWALVEVKLGSNSIESAAAHLKKIASKVNQDKEGKPSFMMVLTGGKTAYRREDDILVAPLASLAP